MRRAAESRIGRASAAPRTGYAPSRIGAAEALHAWPTPDGARPWRRSTANAVTWPGLNCADP